MMNRRGFLGAVLAAAAAPAIVRASSLMPVAPKIIVPPQFDPSDPLGQRDLWDPYAQEVDKLLSGELGTYEGFRYYESEMQEAVRDAHLYGTGIVRQRAMDQRDLNRLRRKLVEVQRVHPPAIFVHPDIALDYETSGSRSTKNYDES